jgi:hypothetical protein
MLAEVYECMGRIEDAILEWNRIVEMESTYPSYDRPAEEARQKLAKHAPKLGS